MRRFLNILIVSLALVEGAILVRIVTDLWDISWGAVFTTANEFDGLIGSTLSAGAILLAWHLGKEQIEASHRLERDKNAAIGRAQVVRFIRDLSHQALALYQALAIVRSHLVLYVDAQQGEAAQHLNDMHNGLKECDLGEEKTYDYLVALDVVDPPTGQKAQELAKRLNDCRRELKELKASCAPSILSLDAELTVVCWDLLSAKVALDQMMEQLAVSYTDLSSEQHRLDFFFSSFDTEVVNEVMMKAIIKYVRALADDDARH